MASSLISFMAKLTPEMLEECGEVFNQPEVHTAADAIRAVRAAESSLAPVPRKPGRPRGSKSKKAAEVQP